jgi:RHS repeat-associated protein
MTKRCRTANSTGKERDSESGLDNFGARYYSSSLGRFLSPDWSAVPSPVPYGDFSDPQSLNLYGYVRNNPLNHVDADGHCCEDEVKFLGQELIGAGKGLVNVVPSVYNTAATFLNAQFVNNNLPTLPLAPTLALNSLGQVVGSDVVTLGLAATGLVEGEAGAAADVQANRARRHGVRESGPKSRRSD